jgi:hypothetical protein
MHVIASRDWSSAFVLVLVLASTSRSRGSDEYEHEYEYDQSAATSCGTFRGDRLSSRGAQHMFGYLRDWPNRMAYSCDLYAGFNVGLSEMGEHLDSNTGSLDESEHRAERA